MLRKPVVFVLMMLSSALAQAPLDSLPLRRTVGDSTVKSKADPKVEVKIEKPIAYVGGDRFVLYRIADAELHVFVDADASKNVKRLYCVQFEEYLPNNQHKHDYSPDRVIEAAGWQWHTNPVLRPKGDQSPANSDGGHMLALLESKGYKLEGEYARLRLVHLTDASLRKELMIIYMEPSSGALDAEGLKKRAFAGMKIEH